VLQRKRLELGSLEVAALLRSFDERAGLFGFQKIVQLVLRQRSSMSFRGLRRRGTSNLLTLRGDSYSCQERASRPGRVL
jgi:hypothetical protein